MNTSVLNDLKKKNNNMKFGAVVICAILTISIASEVVIISFSYG